MAVIPCAIKGVIKFDINQYLNDRRERLEENLRLLCPHVKFVQEGENISVGSTFVSPSGTQAYICQQCGRENYDHPNIVNDLEYWNNNPNKLIEHMKRMNKMAAKLGRR